MLLEPLGDPLASRSSENLGHNLHDEILVGFMARFSPVPNKVVRFDWLSRSIAIVGQKIFSCLLESLLKRAAQSVQKDSVFVRPGLGLGAFGDGAEDGLRDRGGTKLELSDD